MTLGGPDVPLWEVALRLVAAAICGAVVGYDRERRSHPAGLRTHVLVSVGAATILLPAAAMMRSGGASITVTHVMQGIVAGIGFLGAGCILHSRGRVQGLTTAAGIWVVSAIGAACGLGQYALAAMSTALVFGTLAGLKALERRTGTSDESSAEDGAEAPGEDEEKPARRPGR
jgi:putative Mg2+ transporter-C (MgtC) family protein